MKNDHTEPDETGSAELLQTLEDLEKTHIRSLEAQNLLLERVANLEEIAGALYLAVKRLGERVGMEITFKAPPPPSVN